MDLTGTTALITGGTRIGASVALALATRGANVALTYARSRDEAEATATRIRQLGRSSIALHADLSDPAQCQATVDKTAQQLGRLDILINMASIYTSHPFDSVTLAHWNEALDVDLRASFLCAQAAVPHMRRQGGGRIVNVSDWVAASGRPRYPGYLLYYVAKAGVIALGEALALELAADQILVNTIAPGPIAAPPGTSDEEIQAIATATPLGRWGGADEIAKAVLLLVETDFITGETIRVDGGRHVK
ncbi:MAG: SDR family oxidoreductase [Acidobacteriaceae bacterium]|jgi:NAD(P)-dependent dehydrogenase (short-subunit alcohol dehydrogenase family)|nr:SDR family oxidoreductase [Acidobacteriaceae bacterium]